MSSRDWYKLNYSRQRVSDTGLEHLNLWKERTDTVEEVDFSQNDLSAGGLRSVLDVCLRCRKLRVLKLFKNQIDDNGAAALAELCKKCPTLEEIHLSHNYFTSAGVERIVEAAESARSESSTPLWLRLEQNDVIEPDRVLKAMQSRFSVCERRRDKKCTARVCCYGKKVHLPYFTHQRSRNRKGNWEDWDPHGEQIQDQWDQSGQRRAVVLTARSDVPSPPRPKAGPAGPPPGRDPMQDQAQRRSPSSVPRQRPHRSDGRCGHERPRDWSAERSHGGGHPPNPRGSTGSWSAPRSDSRAPPRPMRRAHPRRHPLRVSGLRRHHQRERERRHLSPGRRGASRRMSRRTRYHLASRAGSPRRDRAHRRRPRSPRAMERGRLPGKRRRGASISPRSHRLPQRRRVDFPGRPGPPDEAHRPTAAAQGPGPPSISQNSTPCALPKSTPAPATAALDPPGAQSRPPQDAPQVGMRDRSVSVGSSSSEFSTSSSGSSPVVVPARPPVSGGSLPSAAVGAATAPTGGAATVPPTFAAASPVESSCAAPITGSAALPTAGTVASGRTAAHSAESGSDDDGHGAPRSVQRSLASSEPSRGRRRPGDPGSASPSSERRWRLDRGCSPPSRSRSRSPGPALAVPPGGCALVTAGGVSANAGGGDVATGDASREVKERMETLKERLSQKLGDRSATLGAGTGLGAAPPTSVAFSQESR